MSESSEEKPSRRGGVGRWGLFGCALLLVGATGVITVGTITVAMVWGDATTQSVWTAGLLITMTALSVASMAAVLGIWADRNPKRPPTFALSMSVLVMLTMTVGLMQAYLDAIEYAEMRAELSRMLIMLGDVADESGDPELAAFLDEELARQAKQNPRVARKTKRMRAKNRAKRKGLKAKSAKAGKAAKAAKVGGQSVGAAAASKGKGKAKGAKSKAVGGAAKAAKSKFKPKFK